MTIFLEISRNLMKISAGDVATLSEATTDFARRVSQLNKAKALRENSSDATEKPKDTLSNDR